MIKKLLLIFPLLFLINCKDKSLREIKEENNYYSFKKQTSPNGKYEIYNYCQSGTFAFSSDICRSIILGYEESFSKNSGYNINGRINCWKNDTLIINRFDSSSNQPKDTITRITFEKYKDLTLKILNYGSVNSSGMKEYSFENANLNDKRICLNNIEQIMGEDIGNKKCFDIGNFDIVNTKDSLKEIVVEKVVKSMNFTMTNPDGTYTRNLPEISVLNLHFKSRHKIKPIDTKKMRGIFNDID